jgi:phosphoribosylanthranilate isomerase
MTASPSPIQRTRIKFCGITRAQDAELAVALGVDALGFVLVPESPRFIAAEAAAEIRHALPPLVSSVALFRNAEPAFVREVLRLLQPSLAQFHGEEDAAYCESFGLPYLKSVAMAGPQDLPKLAKTYASAAALLLDGHGANQMGGSGQTFDWSRVPTVAKPLVLAGGLKPDNVAAGIAALRPFAVDVSSGIEASPSIKDSEKMRAFARAVQRADQELNA